MSCRACQPAALQLLRKHHKMHAARHARGWHMNHSMRGCTLALHDTSPGSHRGMSWQHTWRGGLGLAWPPVAVPVVPCRDRFSVGSRHMALCETLVCCHQFPVDMSCRCKALVRVTAAPAPARTVDI